MTSSRRLLWLLLPLLLVLSQHAQLRHEISEHAGQTQSQHKSPDGDRCTICLAFAQVAGIATSNVAAPVLLAGLSFHHGSAVAVTVAQRRLLAARSRGPPVFAIS